jgi:hypothetical protein
VTNAVGVHFCFAVAIFGIGMLLGVDYAVAHALGAGRLERAHRALLHGALLAGLLSIGCEARRQDSLVAASRNSDATSTEAFSARYSSMFSRSSAALGRMRKVPAPLTPFALVRGSSLEAEP